MHSAWINSPVCSTMRPVVISSPKDSSWACPGCISKAMVPHHFVITDLFEILMILLRKELPWWGRLRFCTPNAGGWGLIPGPGTGSTSGKESSCQCRRHIKYGFDLWVRKISWRRKWQPIPVFLPGESHGQRSLAKSQTQLNQLSTHTLLRKGHFPRCTHTLYTHSLTNGFQGVRSLWFPSLITQGRATQSMAP